MSNYLNKYYYKDNTQKGSRCSLIEKMCMKYMAMYKANKQDLN